MAAPLKVSTFAATPVFAGLAAAQAARRAEPLPYGRRKNDGKPFRISAFQIAAEHESEVLSIMAQAGAGSL